MSANDKMFKNTKNNNKTPRTTWGTTVNWTILSAHTGLGDVWVLSKHSPEWRVFVETEHMKETPKESHFLVLGWNKFLTIC